MKFTDHSFSYDQRFAGIDGKNLSLMTPEQYSINAISEKYRGAFKTILNIFRKIQEYQAMTENDSYKVFSAVLLNKFQDEVRTMVGDKAVENVLDAISSSTGTDSLV